MANIRPLTKDDMLKLKAAVLYIINKCDELDYYHLFKILYFADKEHYAKYGRRIIKDTFCALPKGPVPSILFDAIKVTCHQNDASPHSPLRIIADSLEASDPTCYFILSAKEKADMDELSSSDILLLDKSIEENKNLSVPQLTLKSHDEAWQKAWDTKNNSEMEPILMAKSGGASQAMIDYIKDNEEIDSLFN